MQKYFLIYLICFVNSATAQEFNFYVQVKINNLPPGNHGATLSLLDNLKKGTKYTDSVSNPDNVVVFKGYLKDEASATINIQKAGGLNFALGNNDSVFIELTAGKQKEYKIYGSKRATQMAEYMYNSFIPQSEALRKQKAVSDSLKLHDASEKEIEKAAFIYDSLYFRYFRYNTAFADTAVSATAVFYALFRYFSDTGHINISANVERAVLRFDTITPIKALLQDYNISKNSHTALNNDEVLDIDKYFSDEMMIGIKRALKSKKLILVDFWASWCVPCREEFPFLNEAYEKFQGSGFDIISISLDSKKELWEKSVSSSALLWSNQFWDKDAWESKTVKTLNIKSIPRNYLIDEKGKIYAKDLRGPELMVILKRLL